MSSQEAYRHISAEEFSKLDFTTVTLLDLREPDEVLVSGIEGAINLPFSAGFEQLDTIPKDKPVVVFCRVGDWSEQIAEILADRGYDVSALDGGYNAYRALKSPVTAKEIPANTVKTDRDEPVLSGRWSFIPLPRCICIQAGQNRRLRVYMMTRFG